jgi:hypothetical protein
MGRSPLSKAGERENNDALGFQKEEAMVVMAAKEMKWKGRRQE